MLFLDIETRSRVDLRKVGVYKYAEDPDFRILMCAWAHDDDPIQVAIGEKAVRAIPGLKDSRTLKCAHNAMFERVCFSAGRAALPPAEWHDTMALAAEHGYPMSLDQLARALKCTPKDSAGSRLINLFCKPDRAGEFNTPEDYPMEWLDFIAYCEQDVETLREVAGKLDPWPPGEREAWVVDQLINDQGMQIDVEMAWLARAASQDNHMEQELEVMSITGVANPGSVTQLQDWLGMPNLQAETVQAALDGPLQSDVRRVLELRQDLALAAASKYTAALDRVSPDGRIRGGFRFFGAHTGRWSGQGVQPHNLPRLAFETETEAEAAICDLKLGLGASQPTLKKLVRALFVGPFTVVDYSAIEARVVAWLAGETWALEAFTAGRDIYAETAQRLGGLTRFQGKVAVLALGYNGGINSLKALAGDREALHNIARPPGVSMPEDAGALAPDWMTDEEIDERLQRIVNVWRRANAQIVKLWASMQDAVEEGGRVGAHLRLSRHGSTMRMHLPSGRALTYRQVKWERYQTTKGFKEGWRYRDPKSTGRIGTYGGRLVENATQAVARDILAEALVRLHRAGYTIAGHVHDEFILEGEHDLDVVRALVTEPPTWATGLPIDGAGFVTQRYRKG